MKIFLTVVALMTMVAGSWLLLCTALNALRFYHVNRRGRKYVLKDNPLISIIIPARDEEKNLPSLLDSMIAQE